MDKRRKIDGGDIRDVEAVEQEPKVFARLTNDKVFKLVLGTEGKSERLLQALLNNVLNLNVVDLRFVPTEKVGRTEDESESVFDVYCEDSSGRRFLIEMQMWPQKYYNHRGAYYMSLGIQDQARKEKARQKDDGKKWNYYYPPIYGINFLDYKNTLVNPYGDNSSYPFTATYRYKNEYGVELGDGSRIIFVDLERFGKSFEECDNDFEKWLFSIRNMHTLLDRPEGIEGTVLDELYNEANLAAWPPQKRSNYERIMGHKDDYELYVQEQKEEAAAEARIAALAEGREDANRQTARNLLELNVDLDLISKATGLSVEEIRALR